MLQKLAVDEEEKALRDAIKVLMRHILGEDPILSNHIPLIEFLAKKYKDPGYKGDLYRAIGVSIDNAEKLLTNKSFKTDDYRNKSAVESWAATDQAAKYFALDQVSFTSEHSLVIAILKSDTNELHPLLFFSGDVLKQIVQQASKYNMVLEWDVVDEKEVIVESKGAIQYRLCEGVASVMVNMVVFTNKPYGSEETMADIRRVQEVLGKMLSEEDQQKVEKYGKENRDSYERMFVDFSCDGGELGVKGVVKYNAE